MSVSLKIKGNIIIPKNASEKTAEMIANTLPLTYVVDFLANRYSVKKSIAPKVRARSIGDKVVIIKAGTASGKSTSIPPSIYEKLGKQLNRNIICTETRKNNTSEIVSDIVGFNPVFKLEKNIGFQTMTYSRLPKRNGVLYMTVGILLNKLVNSDHIQFLRNYNFIFIDEVHERTKEIDNVLFLLKKMLQQVWQENTCPVIILMSATLDKKIFMDYFDVPDDNYIEVKGISNIIHEHYPTYDIPNYMNYTISTIKKIHETNTGELNSKNKDIIVFIPQIHIANKLIGHINTYNSSIAENYLLPILLTSNTQQIGGKDFLHLRTPVSFIKITINGVDVTPVRKVIFATSVAEIGLTIAGLKYCIDTGWSFEILFDGDTGCNLRLISNVTQSKALQRKGRVGRKAVGEWYPCYTKETFDSMKYTQYPEIITKDITPELLNIIITETETTLSEISNHNIPEYTKSKISGELFQKHKFSDNKWYKLTYTNKFDPKSIDLLEIPPVCNIIYSMDKLNKLGMIDIEHNPTILGYLSNKLTKLSIEISKMILSGYAYNCNILDLITIASFLRVKRDDILSKEYIFQNIFDYTPKKTEFINNNIIADEFIDILFIWHKFTELIKETIINNKPLSDINEWCNANNVKYAGLLKLSELRDDTIEMMIKIGLNPYYNKRDNLVENMNNNFLYAVDSIKRIKSCIMEGFRLNIAKIDINTGKYHLLYNNIAIAIGSPLITKNKPTYILVYNYDLANKKNKYIFNGYSPISILDDFVELDVF